MNKNPISRHHFSHRRSKCYINQVLGINIQEILFTKWPQG